MIGYLIIFILSIVKIKIISGTGLITLFFHCYSVIEGYYE